MSKKASDQQSKVWPIRVEMPDASGQMVQYEMDITRAHPVHALGQLIAHKAQARWRLLSLVAVTETTVTATWIREPKR